MENLNILAEGVYDAMGYRIVSSKSFSGIRWEIWAGGQWVQSPGAFYDGEPDHPEGGIKWATDSAKRAIDKRRIEYAASLKR